MAGGVGFLAGFGVWATSRWAAGTDEPWDASFPYYLPVMVIGGAFSAAIAPWIALSPLLFLCVWIGQMAALLTMPWLREAGWFALGAISTGVGSLLFLLGFLLVAAPVASASRAAPKEF